MNRVKIQEMKHLLRMLTKTPQVSVPFLWGSPGIGKSSIVFQIAEERKIPIIDLRLSLLEPTDLMGLPFRDGQSTRFLPPTMLPREGEGFLFLDELNRAREDTINAAFQLIHDGKVGEYVLPADWSLIVAGNLGDEDKTLVKEGDSALHNRMIHFRLEPEFDEWRSYMRDKNLAGTVVQFLSTNPKFWQMETQIGEPFATPRTWEKLACLIDRFKLDEGLSTNKDKRGDIFNLATGLVGTAASVPFIKYFDERKDLDPREVLDNLSKFYKETLDKDGKLIKAEGDLAEIKKDSLAQLIDSIADIVIKDLAGKLSRVQLKNLMDILTKVLERDSAVAICKKFINECPSIVNSLLQNPTIVKLLAQVGK